MAIRRSGRGGRGALDKRTMNTLAAFAGLVGAAVLANCGSGDHLHASGSSTGVSGPSGSSGAGASKSTSASGTTAASSGGGAGGSVPFQADSPAVYVAKVKNVLIGKPPTDMEIYQVATDTAPPAALKKLIAGWMTDPAYDEKMRVFYELAFQQTQLTPTSFSDMVLPNGIGGGAGIPLLVQNASQSFARTMTALIDQHQPFTEALTTTTLMMTPPLMELYAFLDEWHAADNSTTITDHFPTDYPTNKTILQGTKDLSGNSLQSVTALQSLDPTSPYFLQFYNADVPLLPAPTGQPNCAGIDPISYPSSAYVLHWILYGATYFYKDSLQQASCAPRGIPGSMIWSTSDFSESAWRMVTIRPPMAGEQTTRFFDVAALRNGSTLVLNTPRIGFFSTPAFFANWSTNSSNQMRVTLNQALIVALGAAIDGSDVTPLPQATGTPPPGLDSEHATAACVSCHQFLDPARVVLSQTWSYPYAEQLDPTQTAARGQFVFHGQVNQNINSINDFAKELATHPLLPSAWVQKLCYYVNSQACDPNDPEFQRIVSVFASSQLDWRTLIIELFSSPLTTNAAPTMTTKETEVVAVSRRDHLCAALNNRLQLVDVCGLDVTTPGSLVSTIVAGLPSDGYGRGSLIPVLPTAPTLFYRAGLENICQTVAGMLIDTAAPPTRSPNALQWKSTSDATVDAAISDFVSILMGVESTDARSAPMQATLKAHYTAALTETVSDAGVVDGGKPLPLATATEALESTFMVACLSPSVAGIGM